MPLPKAQGRTLNIIHAFHASTSMDLRRSNNEFGLEDHRGRSPVERALSCISPSLENQFLSFGAAPYHHRVLMYQRRCYLLFALLTVAIVGLCVAAFLVLLTHQIPAPTHRESLRKNADNALDEHRLKDFRPDRVSKKQSRMRNVTDFFDTSLPEDEIPFPRPIAHNSESLVVLAEKGIPQIDHSKEEQENKILEASSVFVLGSEDNNETTSVDRRNRNEYQKSQPVLSLSEVLEHPRASPKRDHFVLWMPMKELDKDTFDLLLIHDELGNLVLADANKVLSGLSLKDATTPYLSASLLSKMNISTEAQRSIKVTTDHSLCAFAVRSEKLFRRSKESYYMILKIHDESKVDAFPVVPPGQKPEEENFIQLFEWNPASGAEDFVFVFNGNLYYQAGPNSSQNQPIPLTIDGNAMRLYGIADWLYEEEIFPSPKAFWWSKSGQFLAYALFDDTNVTRVELPTYGNPNDEIIFSANGEWTPKQFRKVSYPLAGTSNQPGVFLFVWDKKQQKSRSKIILPPEELFESEPNGNRGAFNSRMVSSPPKSSNYHGMSHGHGTLAQFNFSRLNGMDLWADPQDFKIRFTSKRGFFAILPRAANDGNVYNAVAHIELPITEKFHNSDQEPFAQRSKRNTQPSTICFHGGPYDVEEIVGYDVDRDELFFYAGGPSAADGEFIGQRHLFRVSTASTADNVTPQCITCLDALKCAFSSSRFSSNGHRFLIFCEVPFESLTIHLRGTENITKDVLLFDDVSSKLRAKQANKSYDKPNQFLKAPKSFNPPKILLESVRLSSGHNARVRLLLPPGIDEKTAVKKIPLLVQVYAGPNTAAATWNTPSALLNFFASVRGWAVAQIDGRGSSGLGWKLRAPIYRNLGGPELDDQLETLSLLLKHHQFLDPEKVAFFGWSYGGFASLHIGARDGGHLVRCIVSVAPVTDFHLYDSAYTERYMGSLPQDNPEGYAHTSLLVNRNDSYLDAFSRVHLMLAHGLADDNVHYRNSAFLVRLLEARGIHFLHYVYPDEDHGIDNLKLHLYSEMETFLGSPRCFGEMSH